MGVFFVFDTKMRHNRPALHKVEMRHIDSHNTSKNSHINRHKN